MKLLLCCCCCCCCFVLWKKWTIPQPQIFKAIVSGFRGWIYLLLVFGSFAFYMDDWTTGLYWMDELNIWFMLYMYEGDLPYIASKHITPRNGLWFGGNVTSAKGESSLILTNSHLQFMCRMQVELCKTSDINAMHFAI